MLKKLSFLLWVSLCISLNIVAQETVQQNIHPVSPEAAALAKFVNFPVNYSTGVPNISIPLLTIKSGELELPIILNYHAGGIKVNERSTWVGLGWSLSEEPQITRTVHNLPDEMHTVGFLSFNSNNFQFNTINMQRLATNLSDADPDEFFFQLKNSSGKFYFVHSYNSTDYSAATIPYSSVDIKMFHGDTTIIKDVDGTVYRFGKSLTGAVATELYMNSLFAKYPSAWKYTEMISPSKKDTIFFKYGHRTKVTNIDYNETISVTDSLFDFLTYSNIPIPSLYKPINSFNASVYNISPFMSTPLPRVINSNAGGNSLFVPQVNSAYTPVASQSIPGVGGSNAIVTDIDSVIKINQIISRSGIVYFYQHGSANALDSIRVQDYDGNWVKSIKFGWHYENLYPPNGDSPDVRIILDSLIIRGSDGKPAEKYTFDYNSGRDVPFGIKHSDPWGYYNGEKDTWLTGDVETSVPQQNISAFVTSFHCSDSDPNESLNAHTMHFFIGSNFADDPSYTGIFSLRAIHYPEGGRTEFTFEPNQYILNDTLTWAGGLRIHDIRFYKDGTPNVSLQKIYKYGNNENGAGILHAWNDPSNYRYDGIITYLYPYLQYFNSDGYPSSFTSVTNINTVYSERIRTYSARSYQDMCFSDGSPMVYSTVTEYDMDQGVKTGKTTYTFDYSSNRTILAHKGPFTVPSYDEWRDGGLLSQTEYVYSSGKYVWVKKKESSYTPFTYDAITGNKVYQTGFLQKGPVSNPDPHENDDNYVAYRVEVYSDYHSGAIRPAQERIYTRGLSDTTRILKEVTNYQYNYDLLPVTISTTDGLGNTKIVNKIYTSSIPALKALNILNQPLETITSIDKGGNTYVLNAHFTNYLSNGYKQNEQEIEPLTPLLSSGFHFYLPSDTSFKTKLSYDVYDERGNIRQITDRNNAVTSYIWDYNKLYAVAEVKNAISSEIAYTSFEAKGYGNWKFGPGVIPANGVSANDSRTGVKCYNLANGRLFRDSLNSNKVYIVSYWTKNTAPVTVSGVAPSSAILIKTVGAWNYYTQQVTGQTTITVSGTGYIDELCLFPVDAEMTTYTYDPRYGLTSSTDPKGETTYFQYDSYARLNYIKDQQGNVLKQYKYHYNFQ